jgi:SAM-dependent methyltransferase
MNDAPFPPPQLVTRVGSLEDSDDAVRAYEQLGAEKRATLVDILPDGWSFEGKRVLDFGSGAGRVLRHFLSEAQTAELWGTDIDAASIEWLQENLCPPLRTLRCSIEPPLGLEHGSFDLIWALSVFTHLTDNSLPWLLELHRLLKPQSLLVATYLGPWHQELLTGEKWDEDRVGMNILRHNRPWERGGPVVLMSDWWVRAHWGRAFEILEIRPWIRNQSWALMRRRNVELTVEDLEEPENDPREFAALRYNLRQVQREVELVQQAGNVEKVDFSDTLSWRITRPLRAAGRFIRSLRAR